MRPGKRDTRRERDKGSDCCWLMLLPKKSDLGIAATAAAAAFEIEYECAATIGAVICVPHFCCASAVTNEKSFMSFSASDLSTRRRLNLIAAAIGRRVEWADGTQ